MSGLNKNKKIGKEGNLSKTNWLFLAAILALTILIYSNTIKSGFIYQLDDDVYITNCDAIKAINPENLHIIFSNAYAGLYLPLTMLSFMIEYQFFGLNASGYHAINLIIHLLNVVLVFFLIYKFKPRPYFAGFVALFFAIHPMHVESVSWLSERKDLLFSMFYLLGLNIYFGYTKTNQVKYYLGTLLCFILALFSKTLAISFPFFLVLFDWFLQRKVFSIKVLAEKAPFFALSLTFGLVAIYFGKTLNVNDDITPVFSWFNRIFLVSDAIIFYLYKIVAPFGLSVYHYYPKTVDGILPFRFYISAVILLMIAVFTIWLLIFRLKKFRKDAIFGLAFFIIPTAFVLQIVPIGRAYAAERYTYLSYIGLFFIIFLLYEQLVNTNTKIATQLKYGLAGLFIIFVSGFSYLTWDRNKDWKDSLTMFTDLINKNPEHGHPYLCRGITRYQFGDHKGALEDYNLSIKFDPTDSKTYSNRASVRGILGDYQGAFDDCSISLNLKPGYTGALNNRAISRFYLNDLNGAFDDYSTLLKMDSLNPKNLRNRIMVAEKLGNNTQILIDLSTLISIEPTLASNYADRGIIYYKIRNFEQAIADFTKALQIKPSLSNIYFNRGNAYFTIGNYELAISDFTKNIEIGGEPASAFFNRGICYLKINKIELACSDWQQAEKYGNADASEKIRTFCK